MSARSGVAASFALAALLHPALARGDSECVKGIRATTASERATMTTALETAKEAMPTPPEGWAIVGYEEISVAQNLCRDHESDPLTYSFSRNFQRVDDQEARKAAFEAAARQVIADQQAKQPRLEALMTRAQALAQQQAALVQKGDVAGAQALNLEIEKLTAEYQKIAQEGDSTALVEAAATEANRDLHASVTVTVNPRRLAVGEGAKAIRVPPGAQSAWQWSSSGGAPEDQALILLGTWSPAAGGGYEPARRPTAAAGTPQALAVQVRAAATRMAATLETIDFNALAGLVKK
jgi:hypothetical protein